MTTHLPTEWRRMLGGPEVSLGGSGFVLNFFWEMVQSPWYDDVTQKPYSDILLSRLHCTLGDVLILLGAFVIVAWLLRDRYWVVDIRAWPLVGFTLLGLGYTVVSEWVNVDLRSAWHYSSAMPRIPWTGTGLLPFTQWVVLPPLIAVVSGRCAGRQTAPGQPRVSRRTP